MLCSTCGNEEGSLLCRQEHPRGTAAKPRSKLNQNQKRPLEPIETRTALEVRVEPMVPPVGQGSLADNGYNRRNGPVKVVAEAAAPAAVPLPDEFAALCAQMKRLADKYDNVAEDADEAAAQARELSDRLRRASKELQQPGSAKRSGRGLCRVCGKGFRSEEHRAHKDGNLPSD